MCTVASCFLAGCAAKDGLLQILTGLADIHCREVVHCDLKPSNIMFFTSDHKWKLIDLDSAMSVGKPSVVYPTLRYAAPEIIKAKVEGKAEISVETPADMWSFGIIVFEIIAGAHNVEAVIAYLCVSGRSFYPLEQTSTKIEKLLCSDKELIDCEKLECIDEPQVRSLLKKLILMNPAIRRSATQAAKHATFKSDLSTTQRQTPIKTVISR